MRINSVAPLKNYYFCILHSGMKPLLSICALLILAQALLIGNLFAPDFPETISDNLGLFQVQKQVLQEPFLIPGKASVHQNLMSKNGWFPIQFTNKAVIKNISFIPVAEKIQFQLSERKVYYSIPVYLINSTLRL